MSEQTTQPPAPAPSSDKTNVPLEHHYHHEAEKTELEKWLVKLGEKLKPYKNQLLIGVIAFAVALVAVPLILQSASSNQTEQWEEFVGYSTPEDFAQLAEKNPDSTVAAWALLQAGRGYLGEGMSNALSNREVSDTRLNEAVEAFETLLKNSNAPDKAREEALLGLGTAREVLGGGDPAPAIEAYQNLLKEFPDSIHKAWVEQRVTVLEQDQTQDFYAWFREQNPKPSDRALPSDLLNDIPPPPEKSDLDLLSDPELILPPTGEGAENTNTVPTEEEMKAKEETTEEKAPEKGTEAKPFPAPGGAEKTEEVKESAESSEAKPAEPVSTEPAKAEKPAEPEAEAAPEGSEAGASEASTEDSPAETTENK